MYFAQRMVLAAFIAGAAGSALAIDAEQWNPPAGQRTRAAVEAELRAAIASGEMQRRNEAYDGTAGDATPAGTASRQQVQSEGTRAMHEHKFNPLYVGG